MKVVTSSNAAGPKFWGRPNILTLGEQQYFVGHCWSKHKMTRYARNLRECMGPLALYGCANSYTKVYKKTDVQSSTHKVRNNTRLPDTAELRKPILSALDTRLSTKRDYFLKLYMLVKIARTLSREFYLENRVYIKLTLYLLTEDVATYLAVQNLSSYYFPSAYSIEN